MDFSSKPVLVFWETTRACLLSCVHCRASAISEPLPGELNHDEGMRLIDQIASFGKPYPTVIFTGGDPLKREDLFELLKHAANTGIGFAVSPAVTELLTHDTLARMKGFGVSSMSISLDAASAETHDSIRRREGTYGRTVDAIRGALSLGLNVQVNTAVMKRNFMELPRIFHLIRVLGVKTWEVFFLIQVGRGMEVEDLAPEDYESVCNFLYDASFYGLTIRCVEAPFIRRVMKQRTEVGMYWGQDAYLKLRSELLKAEGEPLGSSTLRPRGTLDGDGVIFVGFDGSIHPGGLLPYTLGNVRKESLVEVYKDAGLLRNIRARRMNGYCGECEFREVCGGSRARAYSYSGDPLGSDPACIHSSRA